MFCVPFYTGLLLVCVGLQAHHFFYSLPPSAAEKRINQTEACLVPISPPFIQFLLACLPREDL